MLRHDFELRSSLIAVDRAFRISPIKGVKQIGLEVTNSFTRIQEINSPKNAYFKIGIERRTNPNNNEEHLFWSGFDRPITDSMKRAVAVARLEHRSKPEIESLKAQMELMKIIESHALGLPVGQALNFVAPRGIEAEDGISFGQISNVDGKLVQEYQLTPFDNKNDIQTFTDLIQQKQQIIISNDPNGEMSSLLFWVTKGTPIDYKNDLPQLIYQSLGRQNINLFIRSNIPADRNIFQSAIVTGFGGSDISQLNQKHISVSIPDSQRVAENSPETILTSAAVITARIVTGEELVNTTIIETVAPVSVIEASEPASVLQSHDKTFIDYQEAKSLVKITVPAISETLNYATVSVFANKIPEVQSNLSSSVIVPEGKLPYKIKKEKEVKNERIIIKTEPTTAKESPLAPDKKEGRIKKGNPTIEEKPLKAIETVVFLYKAPEEVPETCSPELKGKVLSHGEQITVKIEPTVSDITKKVVVVRPEITVPEAKIKPEAKVQTYRRRLIEDILMVLLQKYQMEKIQTLEPDGKTFLIPVNDRKLNSVLGGTKIKPATEIEKLEKYTGQNLDIPIKQKTKTRQKINISFIAILLLVKLRLQLLLTVSPEIINRYIYTDRLLMFAAHPERFIVSASQPNLAPRG